ncbi:MAG: hypothetical protein HQK70_09895 [Desulfamplus sp.]|nr:hypothetical protein [Desulfamplus sp.]
MIDSISGYTPLNKTHPLSSGKTGSVENADLFKQLLGKAVKGNTEGGETAGVTGIIHEAGAIASVQEIGKTELLSEISAINNISLNSPLSELESETDELVEKLSLYSNQLGNSTVSLKDINTLLEEIKTNAENLLQKTQDSSISEDQELMDIVRECAIAAHSEYIKFQRGDYN